MLLEALPALSLLRNDLMAPEDELPPISYEVTRTNLLRNMGMTIATRPAASGSRARGLDTLGEEDEMDASVFDQVEDGRTDRRYVHLRLMHMGRTDKQGSYRFTIRKSLISLPGTESST